MVLVQEDDSLQEHAIYYLSRSLVDVYLLYAHVEKLALAIFHASQMRQHYMVLHKTYVVTCMNPFQYILTRRMIGGKLAKWIVILQEFDMEFRSTKVKKSLVFAELLSYLPREREGVSYNETLVDDHLFLIDSSNLW